MAISIKVFRVSTHPQTQKAFEFITSFACVVCVFFIIKLCLLFVFMLFLASRLSGSLFFPNELIYQIYNSMENTSAVGSIQIIPKSMCVCVFVLHLGVNHCGYLLFSTIYSLIGSCQSQNRLQDIKSPQKGRKRSKSPVWASLCPVAPKQSKILDQIVKGIALIVNGTYGAKCQILAIFCYNLTLGPKSSPGSALSLWISCLKWPTNGKALATNNCPK